MEYERINIHLNKEVIQDIERILNYKSTRDFLFDNKEESYQDIERFIVGCVCYYIQKIKNIEYLSGINELGRPFQLKNRIQELLDQKHINQKTLSELTGISPSNINNFIKNKNQPSLDYFLRIWIALDCPPLDWILYRNEEILENE